MSAVIDLLDCVFNHSTGSTRHSWERLNHAMRNALQIAVGAGFLFDREDITYIMGRYNSGYWIGDSDEWIYALAIAVGNKSAIDAYEHAKNRTGFIADDVTPGRYADCGFCHLTSTRKRERLAVGFRFTYRGLDLKVTSFAGDSSYLTACSYKRHHKDGYYTDKVDKRFKITREDILSERKERKERKKLIDQLTAVAMKNGSAAKITKALGAKNAKELVGVPIEKLRKVAAKFVEVTP